ncbi:hypothetical protein RJ639_024867 [Escallonia herrerae]|uniref:Cytochrome P450 n=1 Tax=Escallonia herrerae TaxID=1293975 RepID=A0AA88UXZ4_9ASTE|nr:hypothetical protein RJ639_024867 [Escallonia herrerae]
MKITIGASTSLVVSNAKVAREVLKIQDLNFSNRPRLQAENYEIYKRSSFFEAEYGPYWRFLKKICMTELLSTQQLNRFADIRKEELVKLLEVVLKSTKKNEACEVGAELMSMMNNVVCRLTMSTRCSEGSDESKKIREFTVGIVKVAAKFSMVEVWGPVKKFDLFGYGKKLRTALMEYDELVEKVMVEHERNRHGGERKRRDMMNILLEISEDEKAEVKLTRDNIKAFLLVSVALEWTLAEIINHPRVFDKLREEIKGVIGSNRLIEGSDVPNLPYLQAVVKEGLRLHPTVPPVMRQNKEDCVINGYHVATESRTIINLYAVMRDPDSWEDPSEFVPERYSTSARESHEFHYMPFGSGRRACPGSTLALAVMHVVIDLDYALRVDAPAALTAESSTEQKAAYEKWERSNRISLMIMKGSITTAIRGAILDSDNAKLYLALIEEQFQDSSKAHVTTLITKMVTLKYSGSNGIREHIFTDE